MKLEYYPEWKISFWYTNSSYHDTISNTLTDLYTEYIQEKLNILNISIETYKDSNSNNDETIRKLKKVIINDITSIEDIQDNKPNELNYIKVKSDIMNSYKIGFLVDPVTRVNYLFQCNKKSIDNSKEQTQELQRFVENMYSNAKKLVWNTKNVDKCPQWYFYSDSSNKLLLDTVVYSKEINDNLKNTDVNKLVSHITTHINNNNINMPIEFYEKLNKLESHYLNSVDRINKYVEDCNDRGLLDKIKHIYQNDYYFFNQLTYEITTFTDDELSEIRKLHSKKHKNNVFTVITPTRGNTNLLKIKQVLKQENLNYFHIILWDTSRDSMNFNGRELTPRDLEDECTYCYELVHPYFRFSNQRNDVWLRGVGITMTNTPYITFFDDDTWGERNHFVKVFEYMNQKQLECTYVIRRMWENEDNVIGLDNFEATGEMNKFGFKLIDNSSIYLKLDTARLLSSMFLSNQIYGDDRLTADFLDKYEKKRERFNEVLVNHIAKPILVNYFKSNINA